MALRHLQLLRNSGITQTREDALLTATGKTNELKDGDVIVARYLISGNSATEGNVAVAVGHKVGGENGGYIVWNDNQQLKELISASTASTENLEKAVGVGHNASAITFNSDSKYIGTSNSASGAIQSLDTNLFTVSGKTDGVISAFTDYANDVVGRASGQTGVGVSGSNFVSGDTVIAAITKLDNAIESGDTATDNLRKAVGAAEGASAMTYPNTNYIVSDTTVSGALVTLDTKLHTVSGDLDTQEAEYSAYTKNVIGVGSGSTKFTTSGAVASASTTVSGAVEALDAAIVKLSGASTTDLDNLRKAVGVASGASTINITGAKYASGSTVVSALTQLDTQLFDATTSTQKAHTFLGTQSGDTAFSASGTYVSDKTTVKTAVEALDAAIVNNDTDVSKLRQVLGVESGATTLTIPTPNYVGENPQVSGAIDTLDSVEKATRDTIGGMKADGTSGLTINGTNYINDAKTVVSGLTALDSVEKATRDTIGVSGNESGLTLTSTNYMKEAKTVVSAVTALDTNLKALSGTVSANTIIGTNTISVNKQNSGTTLDVKINANAVEPTASGSVENMHKNIISATTDGLAAFADLHYTAATNTLEFVNTYGKKLIQLTGVQVFDYVRYDSATEEIVLQYSDFSGGTKEVKIPVSGIIEEFQFNGSDQSGATPASSGQHNVSLVGTHVLSGATQVYGELSIFDCGEY